MRSPSCHLSVPTVGEPPTLGVLISPRHCDLSGGNSGWSQIQIQWFKGAGVKWVENSWEVPSTDWTEIHPSVDCFRVYLRGPWTLCCSDLLCSPHPGVPPGHNHLGPERVHGLQPEWWLSPEASLLCFKHQGLSKPQREVIPEYH